MTQFVPCRTGPRLTETVWPPPPASVFNRSGKPSPLRSIRSTWGLPITALGVLTVAHTLLEASTLAAGFDTAYSNVAGGSAVRPSAPRNVTFARSDQCEAAPA